MNYWCNKHLNLTFLFAWVLSNSIILTAVEVLDKGVEDALFWVLLAFVAIIILGTEVWYLLKKKRSLFFMFLNLLNWVGFIILITLQNKTTDPNAKGW